MRDIVQNGRTPLREWTVPLVIAGSVLAGCGDDGDRSAACDALVAVDEASFADDVDGVVAAIRDFVDAAPEDVAAAVEPLIPLLEADPASAEESEELAVAEGASDRYALDSCPDTRLRLDAHNFAYSGMPTTVDAGRVAFELANRSQTGEFHEALILRAGDDIDESPSGVLREPLGDVVSLETTFGAIEPFALVGGGLVEPDGEDVFLIDLEPGDYVIACLLPVNSSELLESYFGGEEVDGSYHLQQGMFVEFTVS